MFVKYINGPCDGLVHRISSGLINRLATQTSDHRFVVEWTTVRCRRLMYQSDPLNLAARLPVILPLHFVCYLEKVDEATCKMLNGAHRD